MATQLDIKTPHVSDSAVEPFLRPDFDPADYLNTTLPALSTNTSRTTQSSQSARSVQLPELSSQLQSVLSQLNAQTSRLSNALTQLTDEIIRSGGRLAYEVEVLRGETIGLTDLLEGGLKTDIETLTNRSAAAGVATETAAAGIEQDAEPPANPADPEYLTRLRTLTSVRTRLDTVISTFDKAMQWPLAPSETAGLTSSLITVSAPSSSSAADTQMQEEKAKAWITTQQNELTSLLEVEGLEAAEARVDELRALANVWKGTAEEKARVRVVDGLAKIVEEEGAKRQKAGRKPGAAELSRGVDYRYGNATAAAVGEGGYGFLQNLRNLRQDVYLE